MYHLQKKLRPNKSLLFKLVYGFLFSFLYLSSSIMAQDTDIKGEKKISPDTNSSINELEKEMKAVQDSNQEILNEVQSIIGKEKFAELQQAMTEGNQRKVENIYQEISKDLLTGKNKNVDKLSNLVLKQFQKESPDKLRRELESQLSDTFMAPIFKTFPKTLDLPVNMLQDKHALPSLYTIPKDKKKLIIFAVINILLFIVAFVVKRKQKRNRAGLIKGFMRWASILGLRVGFLFYFYGKEIMPSLRVISKTFF